VTIVGELLNSPALLNYSGSKTWFTQQDEIKRTLADHLKTPTTAPWLGMLEPADIWCADVFTWPQLLEPEAFKVLDMIQRVSRDNGASLLTTRCLQRKMNRVITDQSKGPACCARELVQRFDSNILVERLDQGVGSNCD
jgi:crotonobetainyl-CoA:carnitine CoA-transferase CaiB-like acyl-CoA transferase